MDSEASPVRGNDDTKYIYLAVRRQPSDNNNFCLSITLHQSHSQLDNHRVLHAENWPKKPDMKQNNN